VPRAPSKRIRHDRYLAFAEWRLGVQRARHRRKTVKYFRLTTHHLIIWTTIMRGYYLVIEIDCPARCTVPAQNPITPTTLLTRCLPDRLHHRRLNRNSLKSLAHPTRFELVTSAFGGRSRCAPPRSRRPFSFPTSVVATRLPRDLLKRLPRSA
jgi:hypothetical protein